MFRITQYTREFTTRTILTRRHPSEIRLAGISRFPTQYKFKAPKERDTCPAPSPPPPPPPRDYRLFLGAMSVVFLAGSFAVYAKSNPETRDWLSINAPWFDDLIAIAYQENMTYREFVGECVDDVKNYITNYFNGSEPKQCSIDGKPVVIADVPVQPDENKTEVEEAEPCDKLPPPIITKDVCEIEKCLKDLGDAAINNYLTAKEACRYYNKLVEETMMNFSVSDMRQLRHAMNERLTLVKDSVNNATVANAKLDELTRYFECGMIAPKEAMENTKAMLIEYQDKIKAIRMRYQWENDKSIVMDEHWQKVEVVLDKYMEENQTMFTGLNYENPKPTLNGDGDLLLHHTLRYAQQLKQELIEATVGMTDRINRGLEILPQGEKDMKAREAALQTAIKQGRADLDKEYKRRLDDQNANNDKLLKDSLKKQLDRHEEAMQIKLQQKEQETVGKINQLIVEKVEAEKKIYAKELAEMTIKLKIVEDQLNARLKAERETRRSQELWTAGASLLAATKKGQHYINVQQELKAIEKASGDSDKLVLTVLRAVPNSVREKGVVPESVLREKYHVMEIVALKVALVEQDGAPLPIYLLSWLQSFFLFMKISGIPQAEFDNVPDEPSKNLDTFDLLQRARFWIERGNIAAAVRYVNSLQGASRAAASTWYEAARSHLETRQAAEAVLAHAAALGLQYI